MTATLFSSNMFLSSSHRTCSLCSRKPGESFHCCSSGFVYSLLRHDFFIAVNTKDRLGIFWSHLTENQAFRLQQGKRFLVGTSHILLNTHIVFFSCQCHEVETLPEASMGYIILLRQVPLNRGGNMLVHVAAAPQLILL